MQISFLLKRIQKALKYPDKAYQFFVLKFRGAFLWNHYYEEIRDPKVNSPLEQSPQIHEDIIDELKKNDFDVIDYNIDIEDYQRYLEKAEYQNYPYYYGGGKADKFAEKSLEHYISAKLLNLNKDDVYIDIANANSPAGEIYHKLYGCQVYQQDLIYPEGIHGNTIGGDASNMPLQDGFATKMAMHCSFEHFEQDSDIRFIKEANRVLRRGGCLCIAPLYLFNKYVIQTDPTTLPKGGIPFEDDAIIYCVKGWRNRHARYYDVPHFISRIRDNMQDLNLTIYVVRNEKDISQFCHIKFVALFKKE
ncbi:MAG TPA: methyltransferase domain-containing protein [Bacteroidota bacterium]|nr:methyltransferase domain-containing protein [Candidatus Kapabacteria bacterium]HRS02041.1 methyltransferase domain-containing protein [Bacteroidota bacterium]HRT68005.1 methyltransferase domain-containing protein [Bacteroidota bacterium]